MNSQEKLLYLRGVAAEYLNYSGELVQVPHEVRLQFLEAVGYDPADDEAMQRAIFELDALPWKSWLKPFNILSRGESEYLDFHVHPDEKFAAFEWRVTTESGDVSSGRIIPGDLPEVGNYIIDEVRYAAHRLALPDLPLGYHRVMLSSQGLQALAQLVVAPRRCFEQADATSSRLWGINCQLYTLRSERNWGMGDFSDLQELIGYCVEADMDMVGLNPLHAPQMSGADFASPYSPSDRRFLNPLYIDPERVQDFTESVALGQLCSSPAHRTKLSELRESPLVDYDGVAAVKYSAFEALFQHFLHHHLKTESSRAQDFQRFVRQQGEPLQAYAVFESARCGSLAPSATDPVFHHYLQWLAHGQLQACQALALAGGMKVGLMCDLAIGAISGGAEIAARPELFCDRATVGAPPDPFASEGQDWNLPPLDPVALRRDNYWHFVGLLRANMASCGALRIDHVMGLMRLWWCLPGLAGGAYVYYPFEELLAILRLESHRNQCMVIGEDLGVVPDELRTRMGQTSVYSNKVFYFERTFDQQFKPPQDHQEDAMLMVTNHDVSTLAGWWDETDLLLRGELGLLDAECDLPEALNGRQEDKGRLLQWLESQQLLPPAWGRSAESDVRDKVFDLDLCAAILAGCAHSKARMLLCQLEDLQLLQEPVNIPGTYREYPNWRRKQRQTTEALFGDPQIQTLLASTYQERVR